MTPNTVIHYMGFEPMLEVDVPMTPYGEGSEGSKSSYTHVALNLPNGTTVWLNIMSLAVAGGSQGHDCIDVRTFRGDRMNVQGVFAITEGRRMVLGEDAPAEVGGKGHGHRGAYTVSILSDHEPNDNQDTKPLDMPQE